MEIQYEDSVRHGLKSVANQFDLVRRRLTYVGVFASLNLQAGSHNHLIFYPTAFKPWRIKIILFATAIKQFQLDHYTLIGFMHL